MIMKVLPMNEITENVVDSACRMTTCTLEHEPQWFGYNLCTMGRALLADNLTRAEPPPPALSSLCITQPPLYHAPTTSKFTTSGPPLQSFCAEGDLCIRQPARDPCVLVICCAQPHDPQFSRVFCTKVLCNNELQLFR